MKKATWFLILNLLFAGASISRTLMAEGQPASRSAGLPPPAPGRVYVILWFDTEDYILPESDTAAKRLATFLTAHGIRATFKLVGEKARTLERRGRRDVIGALAQHEIGFHSNTHSQHPTVAEYEAGLDWRDGAREFTRRERPGYEDIRRIFGQSSTCYGQPGSSWAPQVFAALRQWGVRVYLDEGSHVGLEGKPFWYGGLLNIFNTPAHPRLRPNGDWSNLAEAKAAFNEIYLQLSREPQGGVVSLYFHPCEFVHQEFWDAVNFARGANPPREEWKLPPMKTPEARERAFKYLEQLVLEMKSHPRVEFVTASQALSLFPDRAQKRAFSTDDLLKIAREVSPEVSFQVHEDYALSASEVLALLTWYVAGVVRKDSRGSLLLEGTPYGPSSPAKQLRESVNVPWGQFSRTVVDLADFLDKNAQVPSVVWLGSKAVPPESYLLTLAEVTKTLIAEGQPAKAGQPPNSVTLAAAHLAAEKHVAADSPDLWDWIIFPPGFHSPELMSLARLQAWTLKPARIGTGH